MSYNLYKRLRALFPGDRLQVGTVLSIASGTAVVELPDGAILTARGTTTVGSTVYVRGDVIEGQAPALGTAVEIGI